MAKRILLLGDINSVHLLRWANSLLAFGIDLAVFTLSEVKVDLPQSLKLFQGAAVSTDTFLAKVFLIKAAISPFKDDN